MTGTLSRIPRGSNLVASQWEALGLDDSALAPGTVPGFTTTVERTRRQFSPALVAELRDVLQRGDITLHELQSALSGATLSDEDDIRRVIAHTIRVKQAIIALRGDALQLMRRIHPNLVAYLLRSWTGG